MAVSLRELTIVILAIYKFWEGCAYPMVVQDTVIDGLAHRVCMSPSLPTCEDEAPIEEGIV